MIDESCIKHEYSYKLKVIFDCSILIRSLFLIELDEYGAHVVHSVLISAVLGDKLV